MDFCERLAKLSPVVRLTDMGTSTEGRKLPLLILADPPVSSPEEAARTGKLVVYAQGDIHAGEVDGKEGLLMLARDIATGPDRPLLKKLVILIAPIFNPDGNDRMARTNRPGQVGPEEGMGVRHNAQDLDLNRDFIKLETPEVRALVRLLGRWDPAVVIDAHTTNGSFHRYLITYDGPRNAATYQPIVSEARDKLLPDAGRRMEKRSGYKSFFYGDFTFDHKQWESYPATPRYNVPYFGLRNRLGVLVESYAYASYKDRVLASRDFIRACFEYAAEHDGDIRNTLADARRVTAEAGKQPKPGDLVAIRQKAVPLNGLWTALGFVEEKRDGRTVPAAPKDYTVQYLGLCEPTKTVARPYAYLIPDSPPKVVENLQRHGIEVDVLREDVELDVETARVTKIDRALVPFQKHRLVTLHTDVQARSRRVPAGTLIVRTGQPLGTLACYLLEAESEDGLATWNFFDEVIAEGKDFPALRLPKPVALTTTRARPPADARAARKRVTFEAAYGGAEPLSFSGSPVSATWLDDGRHWLQARDGRLMKVDAATGRSEPFFDPDKVVAALTKLPGFGKAAAQTLVSSTSLDMNPQKTGALFEHENDLYFASLDGQRAVRLTHTPDEKELTTFSPDGQFVAYVRGRTLYAVDLATQTERALAGDPADGISTGKTDWVYFEEVFDRHWNAFWWSPDSRNIAFLRFDDRPVHRFTVIDQIPPLQTVEATPYPKPGDPNPIVKLGVVSAGGGPVRWVDLGDCSENASLIVHVGWTPDSKSVYFHVQDRTQTWLDFCTAPAEGGKATRLFRETTKAWVANNGPAHFLKDGSFFWASERTGWQHYYHFEKAGKLLGSLTSGEWEARTLERVDEEGGWAYVTGTRDSPLADNLYRVRLDGSAIERVTRAPGEHRVHVAPKGDLVLDTHSDLHTPPRVDLIRADGSAVRTVDSNPVFALDDYELGKVEQLQVKAADGFPLEGLLVLPPDFDPARRYPAWFMTYGGPHAPTVRDAWPVGAAIFDQVLANLGFVVFRCDPRSASGKSAALAWTCYRRLGVGELADVEAAVRWLGARPFVDASRIGMSGHSYGGFMTSYALTHSNLFAAGIAGAPVTDWRSYDTIYTERYMNTPQENPKGYDETSVVRAAGNLHGKLLLLHGLMDDNVHFQNTVQLVQELQKADKEFELMVYPRSRHGISGKAYRRLMVDFIRRTLGDSATGAGLPPRAAR